jgi:cell division protein FtsN
MKKKNKKVSPPQKKTLLGLSRRAVAGWLVAVFITCAWMFAIGVLVGRGTSPLKFDINELQKKLQIVTQELKKKEQAQTRKIPDSGKDKPELEFYEELKKNRVEAEIPTKPSPPPQEKKISPPAQKPSFQKKFSMKRRTKVKKQGTAQVESPRLKTAEKPRTQPSAGPGRAETDKKAYTIQVAAFKSVGDANQLVLKLKRLGFAAYLKFDKVPNKGIWYRVRVGNYKSKNEASGTIARLKKAGHKSIIVQK